MATKYRRVYLVSIVSGGGFGGGGEKMGNGIGRKFTFAPKVEKIYLPWVAKFIDLYKQIFVMH